MRGKRCHFWDAYKNYDFLSITHTSSKTLLVWCHDLIQKILFAAVEKWNIPSKRGRKTEEEEHLRNTLGVIWDALRDLVSFL